MSNIFNTKSVLTLIRSDSPGCTKNLPDEMRIDCEKNSYYCKTCNSSNCNTRDYFDRCLTCDSSVNPDCLDNPRLIISHDCHNYDDECFTYIGKTAVTRGCLKEQNEQFQAECRENKRKCSIEPTPTRSDSNHNPINVDYCIECNSKTDLTCRTQAELYKDKICSDFESEVQEGCYSYQVSPS